MNIPAGPPRGAPRPTTVVVEVTNTLSVDFTTGIQRVVREVVRGLSEPGLGFDVLPVVTPAAGADLRRLTDDELARLDTHPAGGRAGRRADDFGRLSPLVRRLGDLPMTLRARAAVASRLRRRREVLPAHRELSLGRIRDGAVAPGSVFLDVEGSWYDPTPRAELLPELRAAGVHTVPLVHDVMPLEFPQWFTPPHVDVFRDWLLAHLRHSELVLTNSRRTADDVRAVAREHGLDAELVVTPVPLGVDHPGGSPRPVEPSDRLGTYVLVVGTLEPRKNQEVVLDAVEALWPRHPELSLVLVGKEGWMVDRLVQRLRQHPDLGRRVFWLGGVDDEQLSWLYEHAFLTVAPSVYEGLGVPVMEALARGCPTISSDGGALVEAGAGITELFAPHDRDALVALIGRHLDEPSHHEAARAAAAGYRAPTWSDTAAAIASALHGLQSTSH